MTRLATCVFAAALATSAACAFAADPLPGGPAHMLSVASGAADLPRADVHSAPVETAMGFGTGQRCAAATEPCERS